MAENAVPTRSALADAGQAGPGQVAGQVGPGQVAVRIEDPPLVMSMGVGVHGTVRRRDVFRLPDMWQLHLYRYAADLVVDGSAYPIRPGRVSLIPPGVQVQYIYRGRSEHLYAHLRLPTTGPARVVPVIQDAGADAPQLTELLSRAVAAWPDSPARATAQVWAALWDVVQLGAAADGGPHAAVGRALAYIAANLASPITVPDVARAAGVSHNHLTRLFRAETGDTVVAHIRRRRLERARHLLRESTLSIPTIAASVGIGDLQAFNKACRRELGASPRAVRSGH
ncbi:AraC family transcriptional regulator [Actinopolymorpha singaporensis]|uniref:Helix-turn-helix domain-containing protein n=1 Tax=Actinopolymorpha singaporensis TaxID=117157 RepID=A0A1H1M9R4_9ACTN|nr:AraC family transcriptional regulator [Actinopolymorpha singaporensis]SDR83400.1 Helix-turn-helix domain-containing protein [Actinopolymorpha singaporensis]